MSQQVKILNRNSKYDKTIVDPDGMIVVHEPIPVVMGQTFASERIRHPGRR
ncbi:MAG: hypothetical protein ACK5PB_19235 [Pirellula sp.]|jgi:hypothetical protein